MSHFGGLPSLSATDTGSIGGRFLVTAFKVQSAKAAVEQRQALLEAGVPSPRRPGASSTRG